MNCVVTGGAGFLGSHLCAALVQDGHRVTCVDNFATGRLENVSHLLPDRRFQVLRHDVKQPLDVPADRIYHLASLASPADYQAHPIETMLTNAVGTRNLLELGARYQARFLLASTSEVYGDPLVHPQPETYWGHVNPHGPRSCYDESKRFAEALCYEYGRQGLDYRIVRIFNTYGPRMRQRDGRVAPAFITQALRGEPITIHGDGTQTRSFCYVDDLVRGLRRAMEAPGTRGEVINLGNPEECSIADFARLVIAITHSPSPLVYLPRPADEPARRRPDVRKAAQLLNWRPLVPLRQGLASTVAYFRAQLGQ